MPIAIFKCERCGEIYALRSEAQECENNHHGPIVILNSFYSKKGNGIYPHTILIQMDDKTTISYKKSLDKILPEDPKQSSPPPPKYGWR